MIFQDIPDHRTLDEAISWCHAEIDRFRAMGYAPRPRRISIPIGATAADRLCLTCGGFGQLTDVHEYGPATISPCHRCDGTGLLQ